MPGRGKYSSKVNSFGTPESERENSKEESLQGVWWWYLTSHPHSGIRHHGKLFEERHGPESLEPVDMQAALDKSRNTFCIEVFVNILGTSAHQIFCNRDLQGLFAIVVGTRCLKGHKRWAHIWDRRLAKNFETGEFPEFPLAESAGH